MSVRPDSRREDREIPSVAALDNAAPAASRPRFFQEMVGVTTAIEFPLPEVPREARPVSFASQLAHSAIAWPMALWVLLDTLTAFAAVYGSHILSPAFNAADFRWYDWAPKYHQWMIAAVYAASLFLCSYALGLFNRLSFNSAGRLTTACLSANLLAVAVTTLFFSWFRYFVIGRYVLALTWVLASAGMVSYRLLTRLVAGRSRIRVLFAGSRERFAHLERAMTRDCAGLYHAPEFVASIDRRDRVRETVERCTRTRPDVLVIDDEPQMAEGVLQHAEAILGGGTTVRMLSAFHEELLHEVPLDSMDYRSLLGMGWGCGHQFTEKLKRAFDIVVSFIGLMFALPVLLVLATAIRLTSRGGVIFRQVRVGRFGKNFTILKLRTMVDDAERDGAVWASVGDARVTRLGRLMRLSRLDELPQLWNILRGDMSFVGPRPERPEFVALLEHQVPHYHLRHLVPPGLTGWAQIRYPYGASVDDARRKLAYDLYYVRHYGVRFDVGICLKTALAMVRGAR